jgi:hypothetical protein
MLHNGQAIGNHRHNRVNLVEAKLQKQPDFHGQGVAPLQRQIQNSVGNPLWKQLERLQQRHFF